jgi:hypothetical protein
MIVHGDIEQELNSCLKLTSCGNVFFRASLFALMMATRHPVNPRLFSMKLRVEGGEDLNVWKHQH